MRNLLFLFLIALSHAALADTLSIKPDYPDRYVVVKGDTLWDISGKFLREPWRWPEIWQGNPQIENPHLIYPGDVIRLIQKDGKPQLIVERPGQVATPSGTIKLSPQAHTSSIDTSIPTIPLDKIRPFLTHSYVISERDVEASAYIVSSEGGRLIAGTGNTIYARDIPAGAGKDFTIVRIGKTYRNPDNKRDILGYEAIYVGEAKLKELDNTSTLKISSSEREVLMGDRLLPRLDSALNDQFIPHEPEHKVAGEIISVLDGISRIGQYQVVVINLGDADGMEIGHVLAVNQAGKTVPDITSKDEVKLPDEQAGITMVFRTFERVSYALIMNAYRDMRMGDMIGNP